MKTTMMVGMCLLLTGLAMPVQAAGGQGDGGCNNYGVIYQQGIGNQYECKSVVQYCNQGTGAGAGAGAGGPGQNDAGAQATAGTNCTASTDDEDECEDEGDQDRSAAPWSGQAVGVPAFAVASVLAGDDGSDCDDDGAGGRERSARGGGDPAVADGSGGDAGPAPAGLGGRTEDLWSRLLPAAGEW